MKNQSKKILAKWTIGISHLPELEGKGRAFFPTHDFDFIKHHRENVYKKFIVWEFANERVIKRVKTTEKDFKECRNNWLNSELKEIAHLIDLPTMTRSDQIELEKYKEYVNKEIKSNNKTSIKGNPKKNEPSMVRAKAFCIALIQQSGEMNFLNGNSLKRNDIMDFAQETWKKNGRTIYNECLNIISERNPINKWYKEDNPKDYELGLKLYKEMFPD